MPAFDSLDDVEWACSLIMRGRWLKRPWMFATEGLAYFIGGALVGAVSHDANGWRAHVGAWTSRYMPKRDAKLIVQKTCKAKVWR